MLAESAPSRAPGTDNLHLLVSHQHLADLHRRIRRKRGARTCVYVHDTIPRDFPEMRARAGPRRTIGGCETPSRLPTR